MLCTFIIASTFTTIAEEPTETSDNDRVQKIRFIEDDAQNYMSSKIYELKHVRANDITPFILGAVKRYANNSNVERINYKAAKRQMISVTCPAPLIPYIDSMVATLDYPSILDSYGSAFQGTGIERMVYYPQYRGTETMVNVMLKTGIPSNATEGANQDALLKFDNHTNLIYWKDNINKSQDLSKYLKWLDRPVPQVEFTFQVYEIRESDLKDIGLDYLAWKNGPGLNILDVGARYINGSGLTDAFGTYGFFFFAPSFDFSFLRILEQDGRATVASGASLTLSSGNDGSISFVPSYQNITKDKNFKSEVVPSANDHFTVKIQSPSIMLGVQDSARTLFKYNLTARNVVERDVHGNELYEISENVGALTLSTGTEKLINAWEKKSEVEQTTGIPFLCELPICKYIFGTTTTQKENTLCFLTVKAVNVTYDAEIQNLNGKLTDLETLIETEFNQ